MTIRRLTQSATLIIIGLCFSTTLLAADFLLNTGGGPPGATHFEVVAKESRITVTKYSLPVTTTGFTKTSVVRDLDKMESDTLQKLAVAADDFAEGCNSVADGTNAMLTVAGKVTGKCVGAARWPIGKRTRQFLDAINRNLPHDFQVF